MKRIVSFIIILTCHLSRAWHQRKKLMNLMVICLVVSILISLIGCSNASKIAQVNKTFEQTIDEKLYNITHPNDSQILQSSNPYDYIKSAESNKDYKYIVSQGDKSLNYMLKKFASNDESGLEEYIMAIACSEILKEDIASKNWSSGREWYVNYSNDKLLKKLSEKGVTKQMLSTLGNLGLTDQEIIELTKEEIDEIFAPGTHLDGIGFDPSETQIEELKKKGIDVSMSIILYNLGYQYDDMKKLSTSELDFIFPNTELIANLTKEGITEDKIDNMLNEGKTYKDIISEALKLKGKN